MSMDKLAWAWGTEGIDPTEKLVLLYLGDVSEEHGGVFSLEKLAKWAGLSPIGVMRTVESLEDKGLVCLRAIGNGIHYTWDRNIGWDEERMEPVPTGPKRLLSDRDLKRKALYDAQDGLCWYCGEILRADHMHGSAGRPTNIEHQTPSSRGGSNNDDNLVLACVPCNGRKATKTVEEYRRHLERLSGCVVTFNGEKKARSGQ